MTKRLVYIAVATFGLLFCGVAEAKVCRLGDAGCDTNGFYGPGEGSCSQEYETCEEPRAGATYCTSSTSGTDVVALYKPENCCSYLKETKGYKECPAADNMVGYGGSCLSIKNVRYWQYCGCAYGFADTRPEAGTPVAGTVNDTVVDESGQHEVNFLKRCLTLGSESARCKFIQCNTARRWDYLTGGDHCLYREETQCGGFG